MSLIQAVYVLYARERFRYFLIILPVALKGGQLLCAVPDSDTWCLARLFLQTVRCRFRFVSVFG